MGLSALLFIVTIVCWVRSRGYWEEWDYCRFEEQDKWNTGLIAKLGTRRTWYMRLINGQVWIGMDTLAPSFDDTTKVKYRREKMSVDDAKSYFELLFQPGERRSKDDLQKTWRFADAGFRYAHAAFDPQTGEPRLIIRVFAIPFWMLAILFGLSPTLVVARRLLRRKRCANGLCQYCGYDLRATPDRCPECGRGVVAKANGPH